MRVRRDEAGAQMTTSAPTVSAELKVPMRPLKLGRLFDTLPERMTLARLHDLTYTELLEQLFSDEVQRRDNASAGLRARVAKLDPDNDPRSVGRHRGHHL
ncbi:MAG: hypothetical protein QOD72_2905 [Acidimicrobiaceae bacterium]|nr:hypothetical protein [Acidimicrobiaceae bacterium]